MHSSLSLIPKLRTVSINRNFSTFTSQLKAYKPLKKHSSDDSAIPIQIRSRDDTNNSTTTPQTLNSTKNKSAGKAISRQHAAHLLSKLTGHEVDMRKLGPLTNDDLQYFKIADKKIMCALLGTTPNQLLDSIIVDRTVKSFLGRGQLEKALMTARLAKDKGTVAMNRIVEWVLQQGKVNDALQIHSSRKKWGVLVNEQTLTILFDGCANVRDAKGGPGLTVNQVEKLQKILVGLKPGYKFKPNMTHINSGLTALLNCRDQTIGFEVWEDLCLKKIFEGFIPNVKTYTILLQSLGHGPSDIWVLIQAEPLLEKILRLPDRLQDRKLYEAYVFAYVRCSRLDFIERGIQASHAFFKLSNTMPSKKSTHRKLRDVDEKINWQPIEPLKSKWIPSNSLIDILMKAYYQLGDYEQALKLFENFQLYFPSKVDLPLFHRYLIILREKSKSTAGEESIKLYKSLINEEYVTKIKPNEKTRFMIFNAIYSQSLTCLNDKGLHAIGKEADKIYNMSEEFFELIKHEITPYEFSGYLKSLRRLRISKPQRVHVLQRIKDFKESLGQLSSYDKRTKEIIQDILKTEKDLIAKHEKKLILEKLDEEEKLKKTEGSVVHVN